MGPPGAALLARCAAQSCEKQGGLLSLSMAQRGCWCSRAAVQWREGLIGGDLVLLQRAQHAPSPGAETCWWATGASFSVLSLALCSMSQYSCCADRRAGRVVPRVEREARGARLSVNPAAHARRQGCSTGDWHCGDAGSPARNPIPIIRPAGRSGVPVVGLALHCTKDRTRLRQKGEAPFDFAGSHKATGDLVTKNKTKIYDGPLARDHWAKQGEHSPSSQLPSSHAPASARLVRDSCHMLPAALHAAPLMFLIGLNTDTTVARQITLASPNREAFACTLAATIVAIPAVSILLLRVLAPPAHDTLGMLTIALLPGGPMANVIAVLAGANTDLNACLTATEQCVSVVLVSLGLLVVYPLAFDASQVVHIPYRQLASSLASTKRRWRGRLHVAVLSVFAVTVLSNLFARPDPSSASLQGARSVLLPRVTLVASACFALLVLATGAGLACLLPGQPAKNRTSMILEVGIRDIALALPLLTFGLPSLPLAEQLQVLCAALFAAALTNAGTVVVALAYGAPTWSLVRHCKRAKPDDPAAETRSDTSDEGSGLTAHMQL
ncbi:hypothetical protein EMIHUDRAFT_208990 [Emiliania huxleyi CCMP1516]|uniref:Uncharacterized protein n=2 Tax=Emiliania huxleyi TaxID=2903 RepID=A0A0D3J7G8_EMIH1|nr:hypothetical protein EMIHUDRAFT_208990 [Emiliania huxleyi CCMP1516]EOD19453.1 hypothetical protein EMIHUDRAFT_208990 [Emiliania huxleyi CCMP1516]|eukprot:XP_005771882.1 hypothetical protein EMIHUDRAFT_208990 [Emiliania huxleyi CCMP1516]